MSDWETGLAWASMIDRLRGAPRRCSRGLPGLTFMAVVLLTSVCIVLLHNMSLKARPQMAADTLVNYKFENRTK